MDISVAPISVASTMSRTVCSGDDTNVAEADREADCKKRMKSIGYPEMDGDGLPSSYIVKVVGCLGKWTAKIEGLKEQLGAFKKSPKTTKTLDFTSGNHNLPVSFCGFRLQLGPGCRQSVCICLCVCVHPLRSVQMYTYTRILDKAVDLTKGLEGSSELIQKMQADSVLEDGFSLKPLRLFFF